MQTKTKMSKLCWFLLALGVCQLVFVGLYAESKHFRWRKVQSFTKVFTEKQISRAQSYLDTTKENLLNEKLHILLAASNGTQSLISTDCIPLNEYGHLSRQFPTVNEFTDADYEMDAQEMYHARFSMQQMQLHASSPYRFEQGFAQMTSIGRARLCSKRDDYSADFEPVLSCTGGRGHAAPESPLSCIRDCYCNKGDASVSILQASCMVAESGYAHNDIVWNLISPENEKVFSYNVRPRWALPAEVKVIEHEVIACAGVAIYPGAPGHFFNEILPRLLHLDSVLHKSIPLLWPDGDIPTRILKEFQAEGMLSTERTYVPTNAPSMHRAKTMYFYASKVYAPYHAPLILRMSQLLLQAQIQYSMKNKELKHENNHIVLLHRGTNGRARSLVNQEQLLRELSSYSIDAFEPDTGSTSFMAIMQRVSKAHVIIGPHGANMANIFGAREGALVIEIGYSGGMRMPSDFFCLARNLGLNYWISPSLSGSYDSPIVADIEDIMSILGQFK
jgi:hypothetical protein